MVTLIRTRPMYTAFGLVALAGLLAVTVPSSRAYPQTPAHVTAHLNAPGYWTVASDGGIFSFGGAPFYGSKAGTPLAKPIVGMAANPTTSGYWLVAADGNVWAFGNAPFLGSEAFSKPLPAPIVGMCSTVPSEGDGYYLVTSQGQVYSFGNAQYQGQLGGHLNAPVVGITSAGTFNSGFGYYLDATDGGVFAFNVPYEGSMGGTRLNQPMNGMADFA
jgi:hypothetical protein